MTSYLSFPNHPENVLLSKHNMLSSVESIEIDNPLHLCFLFLQWCCVYFRDVILGETTQEYFLLWTTEYVPTTAKFGMLRCQRIFLQCRRLGYDPWVRKIFWRREWLPTPIFLPGEFHVAWQLQSI